MFVPDKHFQSTVIKDEPIEPIRELRRKSSVVNRDHSGHGKCKEVK